MKANEIIIFPIFSNEKTYAISNVLSKHFYNTHPLQILSFLCLQNFFPQQQLALMPI